MFRTRQISALVLTLLLGLCAWSGPLQAQELQPLKIASKGKTHEFKVEVARTGEELGRGLMFRRHMPRDRGMLFVFPREEEIRMWMRNTYIPLDMIFIRADGRIHRIARNTTPRSERTISSGAPLRFVLEVNAGVTRRLGIRPGDRILHPAFEASEKPPAAAR